MSDGVLAFLGVQAPPSAPTRSPDALTRAPDAPARAPHAPVARSPLAESARAAGATLAPRDGWELAVSYGADVAEAHALREAVAFADVSHLGKLELQGAPAALAAAAPAGEAPPLGQALRADGLWWCPVTPERALLVGEAETVRAQRSRLERELDGHVLDVTASYAALALAGPAARETFARFCALDLRHDAAPVAAFRPGSAARTPAYILREAPLRYLLLFGAAYGGYVWDVVADAAHHLGGRAVGLDALAEMGAAEAGSAQGAPDA